MPKATPWFKMISSDMIVKKEEIGIKNHKNGTSEPVYKFTFNEQFWKDVPKPLNLVLDEAHELFDARRSMSNINKILADFTALARRILGESPYANTNLIYITQLDNRIDCIARDMAHQVRYHRCHYLVTCDKCNASIREHSDSPEQSQVCPRCGDYRIKRHGHTIEVMHFAGIKAYDMWKEYGMQTFHAHYYVHDVEKYFKYYETLQWENFFAALYQ